MEEGEYAAAGGKEEAVFGPAVFDLERVHDGELQ